MPSTKRDSHSAVQNNRHVMHGVSVAPGIAIGRVFHYRDVGTRSVETRNLHPSEISPELMRIRRAFKKVQEDLEVLRNTVLKELDREHAEIFEAHQMIVKDRELFEAIEKELKNRLVNADCVVRDVFYRLENKFRCSDSEVFKSRADDFVDIRSRLLRVLTGVESNLLAQAPEDSVILTYQMLPSDTVHLNTQKTCAIITREGGLNSHAAILARAIDVPLISGIDFHQLHIEEGSSVIVNGSEGVVILNPLPEDVRDAERMISEISKHKKLSRTQSKQILKTLNRVQVKIKANVASREQVELAHRLGSDGIGLYRMEHLYMTSAALPTDEHLYKHLFDLLKPMQGKEITLRLLDLGGDKQLPYLSMTDDEKSPLGLRGVRLLLKYPHMLETQINVCLRLSKDYRIKILIPMVTFSDEVSRIRRIVWREMKKLKKSGYVFDEAIPIGAMIETPSAALTINEIAEYSDFISIGTNDLVQYTMATDRERVSLREYYDRGNALILKWLKEILENTQKNNIPVELCGELAGDLRFTRQLIQIGFRNFSVFPNKINELSKKIYEISTHHTDQVPQGQVSNIWI